MARIRIERAYLTVSTADGSRFLVDRLWPGEVDGFSPRSEEVGI